MGRPRNEEPWVEEQLIALRVQSAERFSRPHRERFVMTMPLNTSWFVVATFPMTATEVAALIRLMVAIWRTIECRLPNDPVWLRRILRRSLDRLKVSVCGA